MVVIDRVPIIGETHPILSWIQDWLSEHGRCHRQISDRPAFATQRESPESLHSAMIRIAHFCSTPLAKSTEQSGMTNRHTLQTRAGETQHGRLSTMPRLWGRNGKAHGNLALLRVW